MTENKQKIKYILYARKSTEDDGRQVQSIEDQISKLKETSNRLNLQIVEVLAEEKSAKKPNNRPQFSKMIERIQSGKANGVLCWKVNRLSRNPLESGMIQQLLHDGLLISIQTYDKEYTIEDNDILFGVETNSASQFSKELSEDVIRGIDSKVKKGDKPGFAPNGYLNSKDKETDLPNIIPDPELFDLIKRMFEMFLTSHFSIGQIVHIANNEWGFRTRKTKRTGDKELSKGTLHRILTNVFYAGYFMHNGEMVKGNHKPMITLQEHERILEILGRKGKPKPKKRYFPFTGGTIRCAEGLSAITAEIQKEKYVYYHCTCKDEKCSQRNWKWIKIEDLEAQIKREIDEITILPEFEEWARARIKEYYNKEVEDRNNIYETQHKTMVSCQKQLDKLVDMKLKDQIEDEQYNEKRNALLKQIDDLEDKLKNTHERVKDELKIVERAVDFATRAHANFLKGNYEKKNKILIGLSRLDISPNFLLKDGILRIEPNPVLFPIKKDYPEYQKEYVKFELDKTPPEARTNAQKEVAENIRHMWSSV